MPSLVPLNEDFRYDYIVTAKDKIKKVVVEITVDKYGNVSTHDNGDKHQEQHQSKQELA